MFKPAMCWSPSSVVLIIGITYEPRPKEREPETNKIGQRGVRKQ